MTAPAPTWRAVAPMQAATPGIRITPYGPARDQNGTARRQLRPRPLRLRAAGLAATGSDVAAISLPLDLATCRALSEPHAFVSDVVPGLQGFVDLIRY